jgi:hypothetical protein
MFDMIACFSGQFRIVDIAGSIREKCLLKMTSVELLRINCRNCLMCNHGLLHKVNVKENLKYDRRYFSRDLSGVPPEYESSFLPL